MTAYEYSQIKCPEIRRGARHQKPVPVGRFNSSNWRPLNQEAGPAKAEAERGNGCAAGVGEDEKAPGALLLAEPVLLSLGPQRLKTPHPKSQNPKP